MEEKFGGADAGLFTDEDLALLQRGNELAFKKAYDLYVRLVQYVLHRLKVKQEKRDEVVQGTFFRLFVKASEITNSFKVKAWLAVTAKNLTIDLARKRSGKMEIAPDDNTDKTVSRMIADDKARAIREMELLLVGKLINKIAAQPEGKTFKMFYMDGMSVSEIAQKDGHAISTITTRLTRLRRKFKDELISHIEALRSKAIV